MAVAEAGSGAFLSQHFANETGVIPVVRKLEAKFRKPVSGQVSARCEVAADELVRWSTELASRGRVSASIPVEVIDGTGVVVMSAVVEWFIVRDTPNLP
ncbi:MAG: hypothetical protein EPN89_18835 [Methylovulum sp.]|nr:MAG: hypothetical protein EPN89_18835 [Methylovulum sp.]